MKDPLSAQPSPYEILEIDRSAGPAEIDTAFKQGLVKRVNVSKLTGAKKVLERPVDRALLDLFHYDPDTLARLDPDPGRNVASLQLPARKGTADAWEEQLRQSFPDYALAHALAVFWYWWAIHEAERLAGEQQPDASRSDPPCDALWENAIAYWAMVITSDDFWAEQDFVAEDIVPEVRSRLAERLPADLQRFAQLHRDAGFDDLGDGYRQLELVLATEVKTARALAEAEYQTSEGTLWCGALMLGRLGLLETIREQVNEDLARNRRDESLLSLSRALSPYFRISALIDRKQPQAALDAIEELAGSQRSSPEVQSLEAGALLDLGRQEESLERIHEALAYWKRALSLDVTDTEKEPIREAVVESSLARAAALQSKRRAEAIKILDAALKLVESEQLERTLAELLTSRGVDTVVKAQEKYEKEGEDGKPKLIKATKRGLKDLERAASLGSARAREQAEAARGLLAGLEGGGIPVDVPPRVQSLLTEAAEAASREEMGDAVEKLREALELVDSSSGAAEMIRKTLSAALSGRAVSLANTGMEMLKNASPEDSPDVQVLAAGFQLARNDLEEATKLDPDNEHARDNLRSIRELMDQLEIPEDLTAPFASAGAGKETDNRGWLHALIPILLLLTAAMIVPVRGAGATQVSWGHAIAQWITSVRDASTAGTVAIWLGYILGAPTLLAMFLSFFGGWFQAPAAYLFGIVCVSRWRDKDRFAKLVEVSLYVFLVSFMAGVAGYTYGAPGVAESPTAEGVVAEVPSDSTQEQQVAEPSGQVG
ncbi:MAG: hypothetical protein KAJ42_11095, partial [Gemmatimonadetes bacterium]|nr:hypothetical protein [Gemmatimonadota bacterium]